MNPSNWFKRLYRESLDEALEELQPKGDLVAGARQIIKSIDWDAKALDDLPLREREELLKSAYEILKQPAFKYVHDRCVSEQARYTVEEGIEKDHYIAGRSIIMGIHLMMEAMEKMSAGFEALNEKDDFEKDSII